MRTTYPLILVIAMGLAGMMLTMSGASGFFLADGGDTTLQDSVEQQANESAVGGDDSDGFSGSADAENEPGSIVGLIIAGGQTITDVLGMLLLLPFKLQNMGMPFWFAYPIGLSVQLLGSMTMIQFITGRVIR